MNAPFTTTLNAIREQRPCSEGWSKLLANLGKTKADDEPISLESILDSNGIDDAIWAFCAIKGHDLDFRLFAVWCARRVQHMTTDPRCLDALDCAERFANGEATDGDLAAAWAAARAAARAAASDAAWAAASDAAWAAAWAAARAAAWAAARAAARAAQENRLRKMISDGAFIGSTSEGLG